MMPLLRAVALAALFTAGPAHAQQSLSNAALLGEPAAAPAPAGQAEDLAPPAASGLGWSGALRVVLTAPDTRLDLDALSAFGNGWLDGHQWTPLHDPDPDGPAVLGDPTARGLGYARGDVVTPGRPGSWLLESTDGSALTVLTRVPAEAQQGPMLNGYHIGIYPTAGSVREDEYAPPTAFIEVTPSTTTLPVSEHLVLGQFLTKDQFDVWPKYLALDLRLIDKIELVVQELNAMGVRAERIHVMSGFRTPQYNGPGGDGRASLSRHMWGDAADLWVDNDANGYMDDLNGDGQIDLDDAAVMMRAVERVERRYPELVGGAATYPTTPTHGPYIHIDARGTRARW